MPQIEEEGQGGTDDAHQIDQAEQGEATHRMSSP